MFAHNSTTKSCRNTEIGRKAVHAMTVILHQFQYLYWVTVHVTIFRGRDTLKQLHYRPHSFL